MSKGDVSAAGHWQGFKHVDGCGFVLGKAPVFDDAIGSVTSKRCLPCMLISMAHRFYGANDVLGFNTYEGELSADLGRTALIRPVALAKRLAGNGVVPSTVGTFEKIVCKRVNAARRKTGKAPRIEHLQRYHGGRRGATRNAADLSRTAGLSLDIVAVCKDLRWNDPKLLVHCTPYPPIRVCNPVGPLASAYPGPKLTRVSTRRPRGQRRGPASNRWVGTFHRVWYGRARHVSSGHRARSPTRHAGTREARHGGATVRVAIGPAVRWRCQTGRTLAAYDRCQGAA
jgi:hypothetical protein